MHLKNPKFLAGLIVIIILCAVSYFYSQSYFEKTINDYTVSDSAPSEKVNGDVIRYVPRAEILKKLVLSSDPDTPEFSSSVSFYKFGEIKSGIYAGGDLILGVYSSAGPCKGSGCGIPSLIRFVRLNDRLIQLTKMSYESKLDDPEMLYTESNKRTNNEIKQHVESELGLKYSQDINYIIPLFGYPRELNGTKINQTISLADEYQGKVDLKRIKPLFSDPVLGTVYASIDISDSIEYCRDEKCFNAPAFFVFRPDGTFLMYIYYPGSYLESVQWLGNNPSAYNFYDYSTDFGCGSNNKGPTPTQASAIDYDAIIPSNQISNLEIIGQVKSTKDPIYSYKKDDQKLKEFYDTYKKELEDYNTYAKPPEKVKSFDEFILSRPLFIWQDPFGSYIIFKKREFLSPSMCEPIIYLYPESTTTISVKINPSKGVSSSEPNYNNGWTVLADPKGDLRTMTGGVIYPYLFWEGRSSILPMRKEGFVIKNTEVRSFFDDKLQKLGLNQKEINDFEAAWLPMFKDSPYYFITFIDQKVIDKLAPLSVFPEPETVIRILMDYKPLDRPEEAIPLEFGTPPERDGFTVVEWGGLKR